MDPTRFDRIATMFAERRMSRRRAVTAGTAGIAAAGLTATGLSAAAQDATPSAADATPAAETEKTAFLFVQTFGAGAITAAESGNLTLTADHLSGQTVYFSDRPERIVGTVPTQKFLGLERGGDGPATPTSGAGDASATPAGGLGFSPADPPNAALVFDSAEGSDEPGDVVVVELIDPTYDPSTGQATYEISVLADETAVDMGFASEPVADAAAIGEFSGASLFIDDCPDGSIFCTDGDIGVIYYTGFCYDWGRACCNPCGGFDYWMNQCLTQNQAMCATGECYLTYSESFACPDHD